MASKVDGTDHRVEIWRGQLIINKGKPVILLPDLFLPWQIPNHAHCTISEPSQNTSNPVPICHVPLGTDPPPLTHVPRSHDVSRSWEKPTTLCNDHSALTCQHLTSPIKIPTKNTLTKINFKKQKIHSRSA